MNLTTNMGTADRAIRALVGILLIALSIFGTIGIWGWIGVIPLATAIVSFCPLYSVLGMKTCGD
jgi:hypothetical protein